MKTDVQLIASQGGRYQNTKRSVNTGMHLHVKTTSSWGIALSELFMNKSIIYFTRAINKDRFYLTRWVSIIVRRVNDHFLDY